jgi:hypothetical protein
MRTRDDTGLESTPEHLLTKMENLDAWLDEPLDEFSEHDRTATWAIAVVWAVSFVITVAGGLMLIYAVRL